MVIYDSKGPSVIIRGRSQYKSVIYQNKDIELIGESISDYEGVMDVARKLDMEKEYSGEESIEEKQK